MRATASPRASAWSVPASRCPKAAASTGSARPMWSPARLMFRKTTRTIAPRGLASWYGDDFHGRFTANGEIFDKDGITAAHTTLPLPSYVRVTNLTNGKSLIVRVNDRGPYAHNRLIDVSTRAAHLLGFYNRGTVPVRVEYVGRAPVEGSDDRILEATLRDHEPAPAPWNVKLASTSIIPPFPRQPPPVERSPLPGGAGHHRIVRSAKSRGDVVCRDALQRRRRRSFERPRALLIRAYARPGEIRSICRIAGLARALLCATWSGAIEVRQGGGRRGRAAFFRSCVAGEGSADRCRRAACRSDCRGPLRRACRAGRDGDQKGRSVPDQHSRRRRARPRQQQPAVREKRRSARWRRQASPS